MGVGLFQSALMFTTSRSRPCAGRVAPRRNGIRAARCNGQARRAAARRGVSERIHDGEGMPWRRPLKLLLKNHSIISVTRTKNNSGMVKPSAFAVVLLKTRSNLNGCSTGMSAGFEPRRILST